MGFLRLLFGGDVTAVAETKKAAPAPRGGSRAPIRVGDDLQPKVMMLQTPIELVPVMNVRRTAQSRRPRRHDDQAVVATTVTTTSTTAAAAAVEPAVSCAPAGQDRLSLWSRLLCRPEVYDPHVEAAPLTHLLDVNPTEVTTEGTQVDGTDGGGGAQRDSDAATRRPPSQGRCTDGNRHGTESRATPLQDGCDDGATSSSAVGVSSDVDEEAAEDVDGGEACSQGDDSNAAEPLLHPCTFRVFDTRRCRARASAGLSSPTSAGTLTFGAAVHGSAVPSAGEVVGSSADSSHGSVASAERRLISREELSRRRAQRRQQSKDETRRERDYKEAWDALMASAELPSRGDVGDETNGGGDGLADPPSDAASAATTTASGSDVAPSLLTNEALQSLRDGTTPLSYSLPQPLLARLGHYTQLPKRAADGVAAVDAAAPALADQEDEAESSCSCSSNTSSQLALDDELVNVETGLPVMYGAVLRCRDSSAKAHRAKAADSIAAPLRRRRTAEPLPSQRTPAGKYPLGSRAYVERVLFAQRRQQECALFALLSEAHRQAREARLRLAQLYYYYVIPILAQYHTAEEVEAMERSLLQCGSGSLRAYHAEFCQTVVYAADGSQLTDGGRDVAALAMGTAGRYARVQPVDYQLTEYRFESVWRELFLQVKTYLGVQAREDVSCSTLPTASECGGGADAAGAAAATTTAAQGSVCVAATVLHSMELFERQRHTHNAIRDAEEWLAWYYYLFTPAVQRGASAEERAAIQRSLLPYPSCAALPAAHGTRADVHSSEGGACGYDDGSAAAPSLVAPHPLEREYLPMSWARACNTVQREEVLSYRRGLKLRAVEQAHARVAAPVARGTAVTDASATDSAAAVTSVAAREVLASPMMDAAAVVAPSPLSAHDGVSPREDLLRSTPEIDARRLLAQHMRDDFGDPLVCKTTSHLPLDDVIRRASDVSLKSDSDEDAVPIDTYRTVNVGCFGLSFFSIFD
ncbi:hypothetical protein NESM_000258100 [Novymonas esmeraldas]|uniref:Uncharacterized protein n=1 Tax=Novymonas esmeraldas TaxID=1808958 RepID=A0AAW0F936_9TRYP